MTEEAGAFEFRDSSLELQAPRLLLTLRPWIDVGSVATMALTWLEEAWGARPLAQLARPGRFYDFTRYRPMLYRSEGQRQVSVPNTAVHHSSVDGQDWLLMHALEPHSHGDEYVEALDVLVRHTPLRDALGASGRLYVHTEYRWEVVLDRWRGLLAAVASGER